jgi:hypothetical protein
MARSEKWKQGNKTPVKGGKLASKVGNFEAVFNP